MKRNPQTVKWTKAYKRLHRKDMTEDSTFEFERKRNRPERHDKNLAETTLMAINKVRTSKEARHHTKRMKPKKAKEQTEAKRELDQSIHLIKAPYALQTEPSLRLPKIKVDVYQQQSENCLMVE